MRTYSVPRAAKAFNPVMIRLIKLGAPVGPNVLLTVPGRKSGIARTTPVAILRHGDGWHVFAPYGVVDWVKNLRAAGSATIRKGRREFRVTATELLSAEAAPTLRDAVSGLERNPLLRPLLTRYFDASVDSPLAAWESEAENHPVFWLQPVDDAS